MTEASVIPISNEGDIVTARQRGRAMARDLAFSSTECTLIATAISEVARNIIAYAGEGRIELNPLSDGGRTGIRIVASDQGPGIEDVERALSDGYSTGGSLGLGLPGARRLMDHLEVVSAPGQGTTVTMTRWVE